MLAAIKVADVSEEPALQCCNDNTGERNNRDARTGGGAIAMMMCVMLPTGVEMATLLATAATMVVVVTARAASVVPVGRHRWGGALCGRTSVCERARKRVCVCAYVSERPQTEVCTGVRRTHKWPAMRRRHN